MSDIKPAIKHSPDLGWYVCMDPLPVGGGWEYLHSDGVVRTGTFPHETGIYPTVEAARIALEDYQ